MPVFLFIECSAAVAVLGLSLFCPRLFDGFANLESKMVRLANRRAASVAVAALSALALRLTILPIYPIPKPAVHDEFGHLLIADTFSHGRLTNATHPLWIHFETFNVIERPTYQGFTQPGQAV